MIHNIVHFSEIGKGLMGMELMVDGRKMTADVVGGGSAGFDEGWNICNVLMVSVMRFLRVESQTLLRPSLSIAVGKSPEAANGRWFDKESRKTGVRSQKSEAIQPLSSGPRSLASGIWSLASGLCFLLPAWRDEQGDYRHRTADGISVR